MDNRTFQQLKEIILTESGISLSDEKRTLLSNRIFKRMRALGVETAVDYLNYLQADTSGNEMGELIDAVSTNVTYFHREADHFDIFARALAQLQAAGRSQVRVWCAAASSGEEPYTLAMTAFEALKQPRPEVKLLATDICTKVLKKAVAGEYDPQQLRNSPPALVNRYFEKRANSYYVVPELKQIVTFKRLNLSDFPFPLRGPLDFIFCRNVMIYFDRPLRQKIINEFERLLAPGGLLFISHSENLLGIEHGLKRVDSSVYAKQI